MQWCDFKLISTAPDSQHFWKAWTVCIVWPPHRALGSSKFRPLLLLFSSFSSAAAAAAAIIARQLQDAVAAAAAPLSCVESTPRLEAAPIASSVRPPATPDKPVALCLVRHRLLPGARKRVELGIVPAEGAMELRLRKRLLLLKALGTQTARLLLLLLASRQVPLPSRVCDMCAQCH